MVSRLEVKYKGCDGNVLRNASFCLKVLSDLEIQTSMQPRFPLSSRLVWSSSWINLQLVLNQTWIHVKCCNHSRAALPPHFPMGKVEPSWELTSNASASDQLVHKRAIFFSSSILHHLCFLSIFFRGTFFLSHTKRCMWQRSHIGIKLLLAHFSNSTFLLSLQSIFLMLKGKRRLVMVATDAYTHIHFPRVVLTRTKCCAQSGLVSGPDSWDDRVHGSLLCHCALGLNDPTRSMPNSNDHH